MRQSNYKEQPRRSVAYVSIFGTTQLHLRNPFVIALWSVAFPGLGHLLLSKYLRGFLLFVWEVVVNYKAHINLLMFYSITGDFERAKDVVDIQWMTLYIPTYIFAIWDSYRTTVDMNHNYILAAREDAEIKPFSMGALEINYLDKRKPWVAAAWSLLVPGAGQLYIHRIVTSFFTIVWWIAIVHNSKILPVFHHTLLGQFEYARSVGDIQWFLNIPSVYLFAVYDSYANTVENNNLYDWEQSKFLKKNYQNKSFKMPLKKYFKGDKMYIISTFEHSKYLELAVTAMQIKGIAKEDILAVPMDKRGEERKLFDSIHGSDGLSLLDIPLIFGTLLGVFGGIYGFIFKWGPFIWGLIGIFLGCILGLAISLFTTKKYKNRQSAKVGTEVVLIIECKENQMDMIKDILWSHYALGVRKLDLGAG